MGGDYKQVGSASDSTNINPYTNQVFNMMQQTYGAGDAQASAYIQQMMSGQGDMDFLSVLGDPRLQGAIGTYGDDRQNLAARAAADAQRQIASQYAGTGLYSGSFGEAVGKGVGDAYAAAATDISGQQLGLYNTALNAAAGLQGQQNSNILGYYGGLQNSALQGLAAYGAPEYYTPTYAYQPGLFDYGMMGLSTGANAYTGYKIASS